MSLKYAGLALGFFILVTSAQAQRRSQSYYNTPPKLEDLPQYPIDTVDTKYPDTKIILYSNNTWKYYRPSLKNRPSPLVYMEHWDTTQVFAYKGIELSDLPPVIELNLIKNLDEFHVPIRGSVFSKYGPRGRRNHNGVDIPLRVGEPIYAAFDGKIRYAKFNGGGFGNLVIVRHKNGLETWYAHLSRLNVIPNDFVRAGQVIGFGGSTGRSRGPHLHFEIRYCDQTFDPEFIIDFPGGNLRYQTFALEKSFFNIHSRASEILEEDDDDLPPMLAGIPKDTADVDVLEVIRKAQNGSSGGSKPTSTSSISSSKGVYHVVRQGDILGKIAAKYGVSIDQICRLNNIKRTTILQLGRRLRIK